MANKYEVKTAKVFSYTDEDMIDIISTAVYDIGYWAVIDNTTEDWIRVALTLPVDHTVEDVMWAMLKTGNPIVIEDSEGEDGPWELTLDKLFAGIKKSIEESNWDGDMDSIDGSVGDAIFQHALFGEIIYG